ncbi:MAG: L-histidine N(alpha)-methyltransferase [Pseudomonadales bacterium]|jgi:dimethylhistidine N-methyltransferase|nr:L-histidine N(alpha)-methyltransferase [Pseudomonadales bacterium]
MNSLSTVHFYDRSVEIDDHGDEILTGLLEKPRTLSPKFFYDEKGSELFTEITRQPEYYLTRVETALLRKHVDEISELIGEDFILVEYGSGSSEKIRILLDSLKPAIYAPLDISGEYLAQAAQALGREFPWLEVHATCVDFTGEFELPFTSTKRRVSFFPGSSIGNFDRSEAQSFLGRIRNLVGDAGGLLLGVDMKKDPRILNEAYNDRQGVTAAFNLNILVHLNREYGADFNVESFRHEARYNEEEGCIQMFLKSEQDQRVNLMGTCLEFTQGEKIHTENSHKYTVAEVEEMANEAGFSKIRTWQDDQGLFGLFYLSN